MRSTRARLGMAALAATTLFIAACGSSSSSSSSDTTSAAKATKITVCSDMPYKPFEFEDGRRDHRLRLRRRVGHGRPRFDVDGRVPHHAVRHHHPVARRRQLRHDRLGHDHHRRARPSRSTSPTRTSTPTSRCWSLDGERRDLHDPRPTSPARPSACSPAPPGADYAKANKPDGRHHQGVPDRRRDVPGADLRRHRRRPAGLPGERLPGHPGRPVRGHRDVPDRRAVRLRRRQGATPSCSTRSTPRWPRSRPTAPTTTIYAKWFGDRELTDPTDVPAAPVEAATQRPAPPVHSRSTARPGNDHEPTHQSAAACATPSTASRCWWSSSSSLNGRLGQAPGGLLRPGDLRRPVPGDHHPGRPQHPDLHRSSASPAASPSACCWP